MFFAALIRNLLAIRLTEYAVGALVLGAILVFYPAAIWWTILIVFVMGEAIGAARRSDTERTTMAQERLAEFDGDQTRAFAQFRDDVAASGCSPDEVAWLYATLQDMMSPMAGPKLPLRAHDDLYGLAFDDDDVDIDLTSAIFDHIKRDFSDWDAVTTRMQVKTLSDLCDLIAAFPRT